MMTLAFFFLSLNIIVGRAAHDDIPPVGLSFWRWALAASILLPFSFAALRRQWRLVLANWKLFLTLSVLLILCGNTLVYVGLQGTTAINGGLIPVSRPVIILVLAFFIFRGSVSANQWSGIAVAMLGVLLVVSRGDVSVLAGLRFNVGDLWIVASSVGIASYQVFVAKMPREVDRLVLLQVTITLGVAILLPFYLWETATIRPVIPTWPAIGAVVFVAIFPSLLSVYMMNAGIAAVGPARAGIFNYLQPLFVAAIAVPLLGEAIRWYHPVALGLVAAGIAISSRKRVARIE